MLYLLAEIAVLTEFLEAFFENFRPAEVPFCLKSEQVSSNYRLKFDFLHCSNMCTESNYDRVKIRLSPKINNVHVYIFRLFVVESVRDVHSGIPRVVYPTGFAGRASADYCRFAILGRSCKQNSRQRRILRSALFLRRSLRLGF